MWERKYCSQFEGTDMADEDGDCGTVSIICPTAIDAATAFLLAFDTVISAGGEPGDGAAVLQALKQVNFEGVSGKVCVCQKETNQRVKRSDFRSLFYFVSYFGLGRGNFRSFRDAFRFL